MGTEEYLKDLLGSYMLGVLVSLAIGLILGLEREYYKRQGDRGFAGIRTFPIVTILGFVLGNLTAAFTPWILIIGFGMFILLLGLSRIVVSGHEQAAGLTTNFALIATFALGIMVSEELYRDSVATAVIIVTLLSLKTTFHSFIKNITPAEFFAFIKFVIIALLILPFLPDESYGPKDLLNPFEIGTIVFIVSFLNFVGYFLVKFVGSKKGILLTAILGGLISSTAVTWNYAAKSKQSPELSREYAAGIVIASGIMFPRLALLVAIFNLPVLSHLAVPLGILTLIALIPAFLLVKGDSEPSNTEIDLGHPLNVLNALTFALVYVLILFAVHYGNEFFGEQGLYYSAIIAGLADTTAITISMANFGTTGATMKLAAMVIIAAALSNTLVKLIISITKSSKKTGKIVARIFGITVLVGVLYILVMG